MTLSLFLTGKEQANVWPNTGKVRAGIPPAAQKGAVTVLPSLPMNCPIPDKKAEAIIAKAVAMAEGGDTTCMRLCFERIAPARKDRPVHFELPPMCEAKDAVGASAAIVGAVAMGELTPSEAAELSKIVESYTRVLQAAEFESRLAKLEKEVDHGRQHHR